MSSAKKGKKKKCKTVDLMAFLADGSGTPLAVPVKPVSWADDMEDEHEGYTSRSSKEPVILPTAPRAARGPLVADEDIPANPPYIACISNLPFEANEDDLAVFFSGMKIANMHLPKDSSKLLRGYGYIEFEDRQSLIDALCISNTTMRSRRVRIEVTDSMNDDRRGGRMGRDNRRDGYDDPERTAGDWRSGPRDEPSSGDGDSFRNRYDNRDRRDDREPSDFENKPGAWRESTDRGRSAFRDRGGFRDDDKDRDRDREWGRYSDKGSRDRDGGDRGSSFGPRRNFDRESDRDRDWERRPRAAATDLKPAEPRMRPKLQLQPRTKPVEPVVVKEEPELEPKPEQEPKSESKPEPKPASASESGSASGPGAESEPGAGAESGSGSGSASGAGSGVGSATGSRSAAPAPTPVPAVNIFGAAKPVDTTAREREIEERLAKSYAEARSKEDGDPEKRGFRDSTWGKRNGEGRDEKEKPRTWRSEGRSERPMTTLSQSAHSDQHGDFRGPPPRSGPPARAPPRSTTEPRGQERPLDRERKEKDKEDVNKMPKAKDEQAPNFVASNKYSMLPDDVDPDNIDD